MPNGYLIVILHAHLPYVRHPEYERFLEERWFFEAVTETYIPLIKFFDRLRDEGLPFKLTMSISPTRSVAPRLQCLSHMSQMRIAVSSAGQVIGVSITSQPLWPPSSRVRT